MNITAGQHYPPDNPNMLAANTVVDIASGAGGVAVTWTQSIVTLTAATSATLIAANANRKALRWMVTGTNPMTVAPGAVTVTAGQGLNYSAGSGTGQQGGADSFGPNEISTQAFSAISTSGTTVAVWEGV